MIAIKDSFFLESAVFVILKKYFKGKPYYVDLMELFHEVQERFKYYFTSSLYSIKLDVLNLYIVSIFQSVLIRNCTRNT